MSENQGIAVDLSAARNKLRQADLLYSHLQTLPAEIARQMRRGVGRDYRLPLETYFFACLNAARSVFFILARTGGQRFKHILSDWRNNQLDQTARARFNAMLKLRDRDVHFGDVAATALSKMIEIEDVGSSMGTHYNAALFGPQVLAEHENPDGTTVRAPGLQGSMGLYIDISGCKFEATTACAGFIDQLRSLLEAAESAVSR